MGLLSNYHLNILLYLFHFVFIIENILQVHLDSLTLLPYPPRILTKLNLIFILPKLSFFDIYVLHTSVFTNICHYLKLF